MSLTLDHIGPVLIALPIFGLIAMTGVPARWQTVQGWLLMSFVGIPGAFLLIALAVNLPFLLFFLILLAGISAR
ncbi:hypothetical protein ACGTNG_12485 [Halomonas sp. 1390]|uniref:hypothetical protein n=1 Tax=Halomonas sp. B23F22_3 TaxID=3459516 RepID=UPI00373E250C